MPKNNCFFQVKWCEDERFNHWIRKKNDTVAICNYCSKDVNIANMGEAALTSHMKGKKPDQSIKSLIPPTPAITPGNVSDCSNEAGQQKPIDKMLINASTLEAEIRWVLNIIYSKYSMNSSTDSGKLFSAMFPDSDIAKLFQCGRTKIGYVATYGLAPYFQNELLSTLSTVPYYTVSFDESLNPIFQKGQMDLLVRFWDDKADMVRTRYLKSEVMGRSTANDVLQTFLSGISDIDKSKILQVSSDGPNVNLLFLFNLTEQRKEEELD